MTMMKQETRVRVTLAGLTLLLISGLHHVQAGCSRFGHSCFGAHGKRTDPSSSGDLTSGGGADLIGYNNVLRDLYNSYQQQQLQQPQVGGSRFSGRMSPYLFEWALAAQQQRAGAGDLRQGHEQSREDGPIVDMRRK